MASDLLEKCGVFKTQMADEVEVFHLHLVATTSGESVYSAGRSEFWTVVIITMRVIWRELSKVQVESETAYGSEDKVVMVGKHLWGTLKVHRVMDNFIRSQFRQYPEVALHITLYLFEQWGSRVEVV